MGAREPRWRGSRRPAPNGSAAGRKVELAVRSCIEFVRPFDCGEGEFWRRSSAFPHPARHANQSSRTQRAPWLDAGELSGAMTKIAIKRFPADRDIVLRSTSAGSASR